MALERLSQITESGIKNGITISNASVTGVLTAVNELKVGTGVSVYSPATNVLALGINNAEAIRISSSGNAGLATTRSYGDTNASFGSFSLGGNGTKYGLLEINRSNGVAGSWIDCYGTGGNGDLRITTAGTSGAITFWTGGEFTEKVRITSSGNIGIGTDNPTTELEVLGGGTVASFRGTGGSSFIGIKDEDDGTLGFIGVDGGSIKLQTSGSSYADKLVVDTDGRVTMPYQPAFVAYLSTNYSYTGSGSRQLVPFDSTLTNIGGHFNTTNKRFVAPVAGMYIFTASLVCNSGSSSTYFSCDIWVNGSTVPGSNGWQNMGAGYQIQRSSLITYLAVNDYVDVRMEKSANDTINSGTGYSGFTGALLG